MRLKEKVEILMDTGKYKLVAGNRYTYKFNDEEFKIIVHQSEQAWTPDNLDISEEKTGYRLTTTGKSVSQSNWKDVDKSLHEFITEHGVEKINDKIELFLKNSCRVV